MGLFDGDDLQVDAQPLAQRHRVATRPVTRVARRHGDPVHPLRPERVDGHRGHERRVDAAGQPDDRLAETVFRQVVTGAEHQGRIHLGVVAHRRRRLGRRQCNPLPSPWLGHHDPRQQLADPVRPVRPDRKIHEHQVGVELRTRGQERAVGRHDQRVAVEDQLVLAADLIHVGNGAPRLGHPAPQHGQSLGAPSAVVRRRVQVHHHVCSPPSFVRHRPVVEPHVLADGDAHPGAPDPEECGRLEVLGKNQRCSSNTP